MEAQAARHYWPALMAAGFRRERAAVDANSYLNYGYTVLRAATARAVCGTGLPQLLACTTVAVSTLSRWSMI